MKPIVESGIKLVVWWLLVYPLAAALVSLALAGPIAAAESAAFTDAFRFLLALMTTTQIPLTPWAPTGVAGIVLTLMISIFQVMLLCIFIGVSAGPLLDPFLDAMGLVVHNGGQAVKKHVTIYICGFPVLCLAFSIVFGGLLAAAEEWPFVDGFVLALGEVTLTGVTLPTTPPPGTAAGQFVGLVLGILSAAILGNFIAVGSVPLLGFDLTFKGSWILMRLPFVLNAAQKEELLGPKKKPTTSRITPTKTSSA